eukprot:1393250-Amorphochlora_amoeboformis.AAC.2
MCLRRIGFAPHELKLVEGGPGRTPKQAILDFTEKYKPDMLICGSRGNVYLYYDVDVNVWTQ